LIFGGGIISKEDAENLKKRGVVEIFGPGSRTDEIVRRIEDELKGKRKRKPD
jgi:methylmalonyl-CoA mutase C-terminal domain/subunit